MTLGYNASVWVKDGYFIGAVPRTVLTPNTARVIVPDNTIVEFNVTLSRTPFETLRLQTVVTAHRVEELEGVWETSHLHLSDTSPLNLIWVSILFITRHFTTVTPHTRSRIKVKTVLLPLFKFRQVNGVVSTLHTCVGFVV
jgi:hypothetical protein